MFNVSSNQRSVLRAVAQHLVGITFAVAYRNVAYFAVFIVNGHQLRIDKALVRCQVQLLVSV